MSEQAGRYVTKDEESEIYASGYEAGEEAGYEKCMEDHEYDHQKLEAANARIAALEAALGDLIAAFVKHRTVTHKIKEKSCDTCDESTAAVTQARAALAGESAP